MTGRNDKRWTKAIPKAILCECVLGDLDAPKRRNTNCGQFCDNELIELFVICTQLHKYNSLKYVQCCESKVIEQSVILLQSPKSKTI